ncbi:uncharacterized protein LOC134183511 [Corticium candelabrum]|uniref:uncharacterized protein LOC134183511 n=1 Tax=Corticium candelabrum TaxID=121492 RepID=UPI002E257558|nr:uncharacterized protein LOC134183511 [Corticium candelabrum]
MQAKFIQLNTGALLPTISLGTWKSSRVEVGNALTCALKVGYRHLDCAHIYGNEGEIGKALTAVFGTGTLKRNDIFVTSKLWLNFFHPDDVLGACQTTLKNLELDCLDLYLVT